MKLKIKDYIFLVFVIVGFVFFMIQKVSNNSDSNSTKINEKGESQLIKINKVPLTVQVSSDESSRFKGLSDIEHMGSDEGMLFVHEQSAQHGYSMRNMRFDLDFIFIEGNKVVDIAKRVSYRYNGSIKGGMEYDKVLEVNADWVRKNNINIGDLIDFGN